MRGRRKFIGGTSYWMLTGSTKKENINDNLSFRRCPAPHTGDVMCKVLKKVFSDRQLSKDTNAITTYNESNMISGMSKLRSFLSNSFPESFNGLSHCHVRSLT